MLLSVPTTNHLNRAYFELGKIGADCVGVGKPWPYKTQTKEELICLACDMSRFDPRLFEILVRFFIYHWQELNPRTIRIFYKRMQCPQTIAIVCEFVSGALKDDETAFFIEYLKAGLGPASPQFYFHNLYQPGGNMAQRAVAEGVYEFKKWGFFANERPIIDSEKRTTSGSLDSAARLNILQRIIKEKREIQLGDYLRAIKGSVSRQQALLDIRSSGLVVNIGKGRGSKWKLAV